MSCCAPYGNVANTTGSGAPPFATWNDLTKTHARIFYTVELLGKPQLHDEVFREINLKGNRLETPEKIEAFFVAHGVSRADFQKAFSSDRKSTRLNSSHRT